MKVGIIQATSQKSKNKILEESTKQAISSQDKVINFGIFPKEETNLSYVQVSLAIALLINSKAIDFIISGCSSGQGMMLACNTFPNVQCGYLPTAEDAFLFAQINNGNVASLPLGLNWGWCGELKCKEIISALFREKMGQGYPAQDAKRKLTNTKQVKTLNNICKKSFIHVLSEIPSEILVPVLNYSPVYDYILENGVNQDLITLIKSMKNKSN